MVVGMRNSQLKPGERWLVRPSWHIEPVPRRPWSSDWPEASDADRRLADDADLADLVLANADIGVELAASRSRIAAAANESRRRIERDLHDGVQQRLVSLLLKLRGLTASLPPERRLELAAVSDELEQAMEELREVTQGIHPAILSEGGLNPALKALARRSVLPIHVDLPADQRYPERVEVAAYYVACEALTNVVKHAKASSVHLQVESNKSVLILWVRDDGVGGADRSRGSGLIGLADRAAAAGGTIIVESPPGRGTSVCVRLPLA